jgi:hypothetical protein
LGIEKHELICGFRETRRKICFWIQFHIFFNLVPFCNFIFRFRSSKWMTKYHFWHVSLRLCHVSLRLLCHCFWNGIIRQGRKITQFLHSRAYLEQKRYKIKIVPASSWSQLRGIKPWYCLPSSASIATEPTNDW